MRAFVDEYEKNADGKIGIVEVSHMCPLPKLTCPEKVPATENLIPLGDAS